MGAVWMRARAELRSNLRTVVALGVMFGIFAGLVASAAAGARRTDSVVRRARIAQQLPDIFMVPRFTEHGELLDYEAISRFPEVAYGIDLAGVSARESAELTAVRTEEDGSRLRRLSRVLRGRFPRSVDEIAVTPKAVTRLGYRMGSSVTLHLSGPGSDPRIGRAVPGPVLTFRVVGVIVSLGDLVDVAGPGVMFSNPFYARYRSEVFVLDVFAFGLRRGDADLPAFRRHMRELTGGTPILFVEARNDYRQLERSFRVQAAALWVFAGLLGFVTLLVMSQTLARQAFLSSGDHPSLRALGMSGSQITRTHLVRGFVVGLVASGVALVVIIATSPLAPFGRARLAEPAPGVAFPWTMIAAAAAGTLLVSLLSSALSASRGRSSARAQTSSLAGAAAHLAPGVSARVGARFAFERGAGRTAVPVASTLAGCCIGIVALIAALIVGRSLDHLLSTPRAYGWDWDATVAIDGLGSSERRLALESIPGVAATAYGFSGATVQAGASVTEMVAMEPGKGTLGPVLLDGRLPRAPDEIALGRKTFDAERLRFGRTVDISIQGSTVKRAFRVTGLVVLPLASDTSTLGEGVFMTADGVRSLDPVLSGRPPDGAYVRFVAGADRRSVLDRLRAIANDDGVQLPQKPAAVVDFGDVRVMPLVLGGILAALAAGTIGHLLVSSIRRRSRDLAILKTIGIVRGQIRAIVAWQGTAVATVALAFGIPLGIVVGRWVWTAFARYGGFAPEPVVGIGEIVLVAAATLILANVIALAPARAAARSQPASVLRTE